MLVTIHKLKIGANSKIFILLLHESSILLKHTFLLLSFPWLAFPMLLYMKTKCKLQLLLHSAEGTALQE